MGGSGAFGGLAEDRADGRPAAASLFSFHGHPSASGPGARCCILDGDRKGEVECGPGASAEGDPFQTRRAQRTWTCSGDSNVRYSRARCPGFTHLHEAAPGWGLMPSLLGGEEQGLPGPFENPCSSRPGRGLCTRIYILTRTCVHTHLNMRTHVYTHHTHVRAHIHTRIRVHVYTLTHVCVCTHVCSLSLSSSQRGTP